MAAATQTAQNLQQTSLYVGDLHPSVFENLLHQKFSEIGPVLSTKICRDVTTRNSLGYGYVNFDDPKDAERALENMNYEMLNGRPIRIMWSQRDPSLRKSGRGNIFIKNLDKSIEQKELYDTFSYFGKILSCKIAMDEHGVSKGYGFVHFEKEESAERAIEKVNNMQICDRIVYVGKFIPSADRKSQAGKAKFNNVYVKNFPPETDDDSLREMFSEFGEIKSACVMKDNEGKSKGFGFVCFNDPDHAEMSVRNMHGREINGRTLYAGRAQRKEERQEELKQRLEKQRADRQSKYNLGVNLYVKNLDDGIDDEKLKEAFKKYGAITSAKVMTDGVGRSKGFGFVCFTHPDQAACAVTEMNGTIVGTKPLYVALAQRKEDRRAKLMEAHQNRMMQDRSAANQMIPAIAHAAATNYFQPPAFQQAPRYYPPTNAMFSQPRWNRAAGMTAGIPAALGGGMPGRPPMTGHYLGAPNPAAAITPNHMAAIAQMRSPAAVGRQVPSGLTVPAGTHMPNTANYLNAAVAAAAASQRQQAAAGRVTTQMQQVMGPQSAAMGQRPSMASVVAGGANGTAPGVRQVAPQMPRPMVHPGLAANLSGASAANVRFNQTARNVAAQPTSQHAPNAAATNVSSLLAPLGDQGPLTKTTLDTLTEKDQKRLLGERLYPLVNELYPSLATKLTGMLLGVDNAEVIQLLESKDSLREKLEEAIGVLKNSRTIPSEMDDAHSAAKHNSIPGQNGDGSAGAGDAKSGGKPDIKSSQVAMEAVIKADETSNN